VSTGAGERVPDSRTLSPRDLAEIRERLRPRLQARERSDRETAPARRDVLVCAGGGCVSSKSLEVADTLEREIASAGIGDRARVIRVGCMGLCEAAPLVLVTPDGIYYRDVDAGGARRIVNEHLASNRLVEDLELEWTNGDGSVVRSREIPFFERQLKIALRNCGVIDPLDIDEYIARDGYLALERTLFELKPEESTSRNVYDLGLQNLPAGRYRLRATVTDRVRGDDRTRDGWFTISSQMTAVAGRRDGP